MLILLALLALSIGQASAETNAANGQVARAGARLALHEDDEYLTDPDAREAIESVDDLEDRSCLDDLDDLEQEAVHRDDGDRDRIERAGIDVDELDRERIAESDDGASAGLDHDVESTADELNLVDRADLADLDRAGIDLDDFDRAELERAGIDVDVARDGASDAARGDASDDVWPATGATDARAAALARRHSLLGSIDVTLTWRRTEPAASPARDEVWLYGTWRL